MAAGESGGLTSIPSKNCDLPSCVPSAVRATLRAMDVRLTYRGRAVTDADVAFIRQLIAAHPTASRRRLSKKLCQAWNWVQPNGALRDMVCRGLMLALHRAGHIELPPQRHIPPNPLAQTRPAGAVSTSIAPRCTVPWTQFGRWRSGRSGGRARSRCSTA